METAKHFGSKLRKTLAALFATMALMAVLLPGALAVDLNVDVGFYFKQSRGGTCTLASAAMMLRRRAYLDGMDSWVDVTENGIKSTAWSGGLSHSFTYNDMHVGYATLPSGKAAKTEALVSILAEHPEGIVLYDRTRPHAVLLTDYTDGVFYCSDPAGSVSSGRVPISAASISIAGASCYWYISSDHNSAVATLDSLRLEGMRYPVNIRTGKGMSVSGTAASASGAVLSSVEAAILDANDQPVQSAEASPNVSSWSLKNFDSQLRFGELPEGSYTYMVVLTDSNGQTVSTTLNVLQTNCAINPGNSGASSTATYWTVQDPSGTKLGQLVQETEEAVAQAVESEAEAVTETKKGMWSWLLG